MANFKVKALFEYSSMHDDDLKFGVGQIITVTEEEDADWYCGEYIDEAGKKHEGIFPRNFVKKYEPTAPPRPTRSRARKDTESAAPTEDFSHTHAAPANNEVAAGEDIAHPPSVLIVPAPPAVAVPSAEASVLSSPPAAKSAPEASAPLAATSSHARKPSASQGKPPAPPVSEKPPLSSFRDRIAAFNKPAAPPVAPFKPGGLGAGTGGIGFIRKPFVAPPPSRNAYVPPTREAPATKLYRREEDPEIKEMEAETMENAEKAGLVPGKSNEAEDDGQPKPTSLKERIALLQKQQMEAAQRHAESVAAKSKPKKPPVKSRSMSSDRSETVADPEVPPPLPIADTESTGRKSIEEPHVPLPAHRKISRGACSEPGDGDETDMSGGAGEVIECLEDLAENDESDTPKHEKLGVSIDNEDEVGDQDEGGDVEEDDVSPEVRRKEELRARMAKMSGGMGMAGMFGMVPMSASAPPKKKPAAQPTADQVENEVSAWAPPVPTMMALPGLSASRRSEETPREELPQSPLQSPPPPTVRPTSPGNANGATGPEVVIAQAMPRKSLDAPPPIPGSRPGPALVPLELRSPPPPPPAELTSQRSGSESDDELSERAHGRTVETPRGEVPPRIRSPPPPIPLSPGLTGVTRSPPFSSAALDDFLASPPTSPQSKRNSRPPPPPPGAAPAVPPGSRPPPPPPPPPGAAPLSRQSTADGRLGSPVRITPRPVTDEEDWEGEVTEYEGDYDTDTGSSVPQKDALKSNHIRGSSVDDNGLFSPLSEAQPASLPPPPPTAAALRTAPPPMPAQGTPEGARRSIDATRRSVEVPRAAPLRPPSLDDYDPFNYTAQSTGPAANMQPMPRKIDEEDDEGTQSGPLSPSLLPRTPAAASTPQPNWTGTRPSMEAQKTSMVGNRRSVDIGRPSIDSGFIAGDIDLAPHSGWWKQPNQAPPALQGRRDVYYESQEYTTTNQGTKTIVTRETRILYLDYSQTTIAVEFDPYGQSDVEISQIHEPPPRALRQDQLEQAYERFGMHIAEAVAGKKDTVVGDGTPLGLVLDLLRPWKDVLAPVGTRAFGALVYANLANASTQQNDEIRKGDIITIRNAKFQGKHGPMHAKYSVEVGKPDHVAVIAEWDGTKKKVRAYEQGRESKKVKIESFKLDDLRSGEVKIWRVMPRSWIGWNVQA